jgi:two-component system cell cycle sensor histidine kinase/response regulator CckA
VHAIRQMPDGRLFFATDQGLLEWKDGAERLWTEKDGLLSPAVFCLAPGPEDVLYIGTQNGLNRLRAGQVESFPQLNRRGNDEVRTLQVDSDTGVVLLTRRDRLSVLHPDGETTDLLPDPSGRTVLWDAGLDRQGTLWVTSVNGLFVRFPGCGFIRLSSANGLLSDWMYHLCLDYEDNVWICSNAGVDKLADRTLSLFTTADGLAADTVWSIFPSGDDLLIGTEKGAQYLRSGKLDPAVILPGRNILDIHPLPSKALLVGTDRGLYQCRGTRATSATTHTELEEQFIYRILPLPDGDFLLGTGEGLFHGRLPQAERIPLPEPVNRGSLHDILPRGPDTWWLATERGIYTLRREMGAWKVDPTVLLEEVEIQCFTTDKDKPLLVGTIGYGVFRWDGRGFAPLPMDLPHQSDNVWALRYDRDGVLWIGTSRGLVFLKDGQVFDFNAMHGLPSNEITSRSSLYFTDQGVCFFGTTAGLVRYTPSVHSASIPPRLEITGLSVNQKRLPPGAPPPRLRHDDRLSIDFKCLSFINEDGNRYQFKLEGVDTGWSELTADDHVFYPYLPPGDIIFRLRAFNSQGVPSATSPTLRLTVVPPFTRTIWFYLLVCAGVLAVAGSFLGYKIRLDRREKIKLRTLVTEKTAELQTSEEKYRELVEGSLIGIAILQEGRLVFANPQILKIFKTTEAEILGQPVEKFVLADDLSLFRAHLTARARGDTAPREFEIRACTEDQAIKNILVHTNLTQYAGNPATLLNIIDVTEKKKLQEQIIHYQKLESIGTLAGGIAHDFNNILQGITGYSSLIRLQLPPDSPFHKDLGMIEEASGKAAILTKKLLGFAGKGKYVVTHLNIHEVIDSVIALSRRTIPLNVDFVCRYASRPLSVLGDRTQLEQVFLNLFLNSRDAIHGNGEIRIETSLHETSVDQDMGDHVLRQGAYVRIIVRDTGTGIPAEVLPRVFDPFFTTKTQGKGSGLGLATVYGIIKNHHGYIYIKSEPGRGTSLRILLPHSSGADTGPAPARASRPEPAPPVESGKTVLIVEDEDTNRRFMTTLLRRAGLRVLDAGNGQEAMEIFRAESDEISLVILDINMPVMPGQHVLEQLLARRPDLPILVLSGYQEDAIVQEMMRRGARDFVQKPVDASTLLAKVSSLVVGGPRDSRS